MNDIGYFDFVHEKDLKHNLINYNGKGFLVAYGRRELHKNEHKVCIFGKMDNFNLDEKIFSEREIDYLGEKNVVIVPGVIELFEYRKSSEGNSISQIKRPVYNDEKNELCNIIIKKLKFKPQTELYICWDANKGIYETNVSITGLC